MFSNTIISLSLLMGDDGDIGVLSIDFVGGVVAKLVASVIEVESSSTFSLGQSIGLVGVAGATEPPTMGEVGISSCVELVDTVVDIVVVVAGVVLEMSTAIIRTV